MGQDAGIEKTWDALGHGGNVGGHCSHFECATVAETSHARPSHVSIAKRAKKRAIIPAANGNFLENNLVDGAALSID
jgi:hypothetical protein